MAQIFVLGAQIHEITSVSGGWAGDHTWLLWAALAAAGVLAGVINTIAGGGGFLLIPTMMDLGLPSTVANGTLRIGIVFQNLAALFTFRRKGIHPWRDIARLGAPIVAGALLGSWAATHLDDGALREVFGVALCGWALLLVFKPGKFGTDESEPKSPTWLSYLLALLIGLYGGFLQAGAGFPLMAFLVAHLGYNPVRANAIKAGLVLLYTVVVIPIFLLAGDINWQVGGVLALGTMVGGTIGPRWQLKKGATLVRWFMIFAVGFSGAMMLFR